jgi:hypothetical protein
MSYRYSHVLILLLCCALQPCAAFAPSSLAPASVLETRSSSRLLKFSAHGDDYTTDEASHAARNGLPSRRKALVSMTSAIVGLAFEAAQSADAAVTDETNAFANTASDSSYRELESNRPPMRASQSKATPSDEVLISVPKSELASNGLGIELSQIDFRTNMRVYVKSVQPGSIAAKRGIQKDFIVVSVNGKSAERTNAEGVAILVSQASKATPNDGSIDFVFRDPSIFNEKLADLSSSPGGEVTTQIAPAGDTTQRNQDGSVKAGRGVMEQTDQRLTVTQLIAPKMCNRQATTDDLLEISYVGTVVDTGEIFDGSAIKINGEGIPGRGNDVSLYFVLKKQAFGQFPPGFDVGLEGMCVVSIHLCLLLQGAVLSVVCDVLMTHLSLLLLVG